MEKLEKAHLKAGKKIREKIEEEVTKDTNLLYEKGFQEYFLEEKGSGSIEVYKIIEKGKSVMVKLSITDKALLPSDLLNKPQIFISAKKVFLSLDFKDLGFSQ